METTIFTTTVVILVCMDSIAYSKVPYYCDSGDTQWTHRSLLFYRLVQAVYNICFMVR